MTGIQLPRRKILLGAGVAFFASPWLRPLRADEVALPPDAVRFRPEIEPLVRLLEETPREKLFREIALLIRQGTNYSELLAATLLAGIRNVQPRPDVGFKFHCVMVIHAAHQATLAARDEHRWFPLFWSMDYFKRCQEQDRAEGEWTMRQVNRGDLTKEKAFKQLQESLEKWDVEKADAAAAVAAETVSSTQLLDLFARYGARDFRNIGHKAIWVAGAFRTLEAIGWEHAEPVMRSLAYALLNHNGEPNPSENDLPADRSGRANQERARRLPSSDLTAASDEELVKEWIQAARVESPDGLAELTMTALHRKASSRSIFDAIQCSAAEMVMRQPAIVPLHAITSTNAFHYLYRSVSEEGLRRWLILQNASFIGHFRDAAGKRATLNEANLLELQPAEQAIKETSQIFEHLSTDRKLASQAILGYLKAGGDETALLRHSRELIFLKGTDSHDYKYSSAIFEEYKYCSPRWRSELLAAGSHLLTSSNEPDNGLKERIAEAFS
ncbi:MAG: hypothetical protein RLY14_568 [Planctomycetota bacterium]